jgi:hypothetical protein
MNFLLSILLLSSTALAANADQEKIKNACVSKVGNRIEKAADLCACIAKTHYESAHAKPMLANAEEQLAWVLKIYSEKDKKKAQRLVDKNHDLAAYDNLVAEDCMDPEGAYASPLEEK